MTRKTLLRSFAAGEISPELFARVDLDKFQTGLALAENVETLAQGPAQNRPGYSYVLGAKYWDRLSRLIPFSYSTEQTFSLEFGDKYVRFHTQGATLLEAAKGVATISNALVAVFGVAAHGFSVGSTVFLGSVGGMPDLSGRWFVVGTVPTADTFTLRDFWGQVVNTSTMAAYAGGATIARVYEVTTPYAPADLATLNFVQSADVLTLTSPVHPPMELRRLGATNWTLSAIQFASSLAAPQSTGVPPSAITHTYRVVASLNTGYFGGFSMPTSCNNDLTIPGRYNLVSWSSVPNAVIYFVYKEIAGVFQFIGFSASGTYIIDSGQPTDPTVPDYAFIGPAPTVTAVAVVPFSDSVSVVPTIPTAIVQPTVYTYAVTSLTSDASEESIASGEVSTINDLNGLGNINTIRWPTVPGVSLYNVYKKSTGGIFGLIGRAAQEAMFIDNNITPDVSITPPLQINPFQGAGNYPRAVSYYEQRRVFAGTINNPQTVWATRSGTERNLGYSFPSRDDDSINVRVVAREANTIRHLVPMNELMLLTSGGEWKMAAVDSGALTPSSVSVKPQGYAGASTVQPIVTNRTIMFAQDRGGAIRELEFSWQQQGYQTTNVSILAPHLFDYHTVRQLAYTRSPLQALWSVRDDGVLLGMTYVPEHEIRAWHRHITDGAFESACSVAEGDEDALYVIVRRNINGRTVRYVERRHTRRFIEAADQFFVDSGISYVGEPASTFSGLHHLEGRTVAILADGGVSPPQVVVGGKVSIDAPARKVHIGLPYVARGQTLPMSMEVQALGQGMAKNLNKVYLRVIQSNGFKAGPTFAKLRDFPTRAYEPYGSAPDLITDEVPITLEPDWQQNGQLCFQQDLPLSMTVLGLAFEVATGS